MVTTFTTFCFILPVDIFLINKYIGGYSSFFLSYAKYSILYTTTLLLGFFFYLTMHILVLSLPCTVAPPMTQVFAIKMSPDPAKHPSC